MDIKQLYYFTAVAQAGSYSKAAESLAVSQPTLSVTVKKLEEELGVQLFYAFNREQHLTDEGLRLWTKAKQILDKVSALLQFKILPCRKQNPVAELLGVIHCVDALQL